MTVIKSIVWTAVGLTLGMNIAPVFGQTKGAAPSQPPAGQPSNPGAGPGAPPTGQPG